MKKSQIVVSILLFVVSFFNTVIADENPEDIFEQNAIENPEITNQSLTIHLTKAKIFIKNAKEDKALEELEKILELDPNNEEALELKTQILWESVDTEEINTETEENTLKIQVMLILMKKIIMMR